MSFALSLSDQFGSFSAVAVERCTTDFEWKIVDGYTLNEVPFKDGEVRPVSIVANQKTIYLFEQGNEVRWIMPQQINWQRKTINFYLAITQQMAANSVTAATGY